MSAATAIGMASEGLRNMLLAELSRLTPPVSVTVLCPDERGTEPRINLFLYKVEENAILRNQDWQLSPGSATRLSPPPISLNLHYLVTAYAPNDPQTGNTTAQEVLGEAIRIFYENPIVQPSMLPLGLQATREQVKIMLGSLDLQAIAHIWGTFSKPYRPSVTYEVSVVQIDMHDRQQRDMATRTRAIGAPRILAPFRPPIITDITPAAGPPGTTVSIRGTGLAGWRGYATLMRHLIMDAGDITGDSFQITIPVNQREGFVELRVDISHLAHATFLFEVT